MLTFFASASDFTRRLTSVEANAKFSRLDAGPEEDWEAVPADLRGVVSHIKQRCACLAGTLAWRTQLAAGGIRCCSRRSN